MFLCLISGLSKRAILKEAGVRSILIPFTELKRFSPKTRHKRMEELRRDFQFILVNSGKVKSEDYLSFILENHELADGFIELESEGRQMALDAGWPKDKYLPFCNDLSDFEACCEFPYIALGDGIANQRRLFETARKRGNRLHGFVTSVNVLHKIPFFSVASSTWLSGSMYGYTFSLKGTRMVSVKRQDPERRELLRKQVLFQTEKLGLDFPASVKQGYLDDKGHDVDFVHAALFVKWEEAITEMWKSRGLHCTCTEERGSCKFHGLGLSGNPPPTIVEQPQETKDKISLSMQGNLNALVHGGRCPRLPQLQCNACYLAKRCKLYEEGAACKADPEFAALAEQAGSGNLEDLVKYQLTKLQLDSGRYMRGLVFEAADGGIIDKGVTQLSAHLSGEVSLLAKLRGYLSDAPHIDNRQVQILIEQMPDNQYEKLLQAVCDIRDVAPVLLEGPSE